MGLFKKIFKGIGKVFKKVGKFIKKQFKRIGKVFGKLGFVGTIALAFLAPYALPAIAGWAGGLAASSNAFVAGFGKMVGAATKVIGGIGKAVGSVSKAVTSTVSNIAGKVGGEFLKKLGIENFMGKDLTKLDSWGQIWGKTQESFAGIKGSFKQGFREVGGLFDAGFDKATIKSSLPSSTADAVLEGAYQGGVEASPVGDPFTTTDPLTGEIVAKPAMTPVAQTNPITGETFYADAATPYSVDPTTATKSLFTPPTATSLQTSSLPEGVSSVTASTTALVDDSFKGQFVDQLKSQGAKGLATAALTPLLGGGDTGGGNVGGGMGIVDAGQTQVLPGTEVQIAFSPIVEPQSDWAIAFARDNTMFDPFAIVGKQQAPQMVG